MGRAKTFSAPFLSSFKNISKIFWNKLESNRKSVKKNAKKQRVILRENFKINILLVKTTRISVTHRYTDGVLTILPQMRKMTIDLLTFFLHLSSPLPPCLLSAIHNITYIDIYHMSFKNFGSKKHFITPANIV